MFVLIYIGKALKGFTVKRYACTFNEYIVYSVPEEQHNRVILIDVNFSNLPLLASLIFLSKYFHRPER